MSEATAATAAMAPAALIRPTPGSLPDSYVETDQAQCDQAKIAHFLGLFGIVGTGVYYLINRNDAGPFVRDQMKEAFNFHVLVFAAAMVMSIAGAVAAAVIGLLGLLFSLASFALIVGALVLAIKNAMKAGSGRVARYPARLNVLK